jgi:hypothetical protein
LEADVQAWLYNELCSEYRELCETSFPKENPQKTNLVHCEYYGGKGKLVDLVVFDKEDVKNISRKWMDKGRKNQAVKLSDAIEIKTEPDYRGKALAKKTAEGDLKKLINLKKEGKTRRAHFIFIARFVKNESTKKWIKELSSELERMCKKNDIKFYKIIKF